MFTFTILTCLASALVVPCDEGDAVASLDPELRAHVEHVRSRARDDELPIAERQRLIRDLVITLDRAARGANAPEQARTCWTAAAAVLDESRRDLPPHDQAIAFVLQAEVYRWAVADSWRREAELAPTRTDLAEGARGQYLDLLGRLSHLAEEAAATGDPQLLAAVRYRQARARMDLERLPSGPGDAKASPLSEALAWLDEPTASGPPVLDAHRDLLLAEILLHVGRADEAMAAWERADRSRDALDPTALLTVQVDILIATGRSGDARAAIERSGLPGAPPGTGSRHVSLQRSWQAFPQARIATHPRGDSSGSSSAARASTPPPTG